MEQLEDVETYISQVPEDAASSFEYYLFLLRNAPKLKSLCIKLDNNCQDQIFPSLAAVLSPIQIPLALPALVDLKLECINLSGHGVAIMDHINFLNLVDLTVKDCQNATPFFEALTNRFRTEKPTLKTIEIDLCYIENERDEAIRAIERMLTSFTGLNALWIDASDFPLVRKESIMHHGSSLKVLGLSSGVARNPSRYSSSDMDAIFRSCASLEHLAMNLLAGHFGPWYELCHGFKLGGSGSTTVPTELKVILKAISIHPKIRYLRILDLFDIKYGKNTNPSLFELNSITEEHVATAQVCAQHFATEVMRYTEQCGSQINFLALSPYHLPRGRPKKDISGHRWPQYGYLRRRATDVHGRERVVAAPMPNYINEMKGECSILQF